MVLAFALAPLDQPFADQPAVQAPAKAAGAAAGPESGKNLFENAGCGGCHTLAAAGAAGQVGPSLDNDSDLTKALVIDRVTNGDGPMPPFGDQLSGNEIAAVAAYVVQAAAR